ncbi:hypothetical protein [Streptomyces sp. NPDC013489]|uniref:hypothetical protein n=1 Tax=Streptomyces sp. NPDC013489 TaxID=3155606 RepID=UPI003410C024
MSELYDRAAAVLGVDERGIRWPYGLEPPPRSLRRTDPAAYEERSARMRERQAVLVAWAEEFGLKLSEMGCCPLWLRREASQRCRPNFRAGDPCTHYGTPHPDSSWLDHTSSWLKDARPAALTAAPYEIDERDEQRLAHWERTDTRLRTATGTGWYGHGSTQIVLWRTDRVAGIRPAEPLVGAVGPNGSDRS